MKDACTGGIKQSVQASFSYGFTGHMFGFTGHMFCRHRDIID